jgi:talin
MVSATSAKLLLAAKAVASDPDAPNAKNQLSAAARYEIFLDLTLFSRLESNRLMLHCRAVTDSINQLLDVCTSAAPGQKECDSAIRNIQSMQHWLDNPSEPVNNMSYFEVREKNTLFAWPRVGCYMSCSVQQCLDSVMDMSKSLGDGMTGIANHAKRCEYEDFSSSVNNISQAICGLVEGAAQAAYLVGISDPSAVAGRPGLVDQGAFSNAAEAIKAACEELKCPASDKQQVSCLCERSV